MTIKVERQGKVVLVTEDLFTKVQRSSHHLGTLTIYLLKHGIYLVGGLEHEFYFSIQLGISSSQLTVIFFRGIVG
jgi:hypothetical protein